MSIRDDRRRSRSPGATLARRSLAMLAAVVVSATAAMPAQAHGRFGGHYGAWWGPHAGVVVGVPFIAAPWGAYGAPLAYGAPVLVPPVYLQLPPAPSGPNRLWRYCPDPPGYYPNVVQCWRDWIEVIPQ